MHSFRIKKSNIYSMISTYNLSQRKDAALNHLRVKIFRIISYNDRVLEYFSYQRAHRHWHGQPTL